MVSDTVLALLVVASAAEAGGRGNTLTSLDGTPLTGELYEASSRPAPGVVLIHMLTRNKGDWDSLANRMQDAGITAVAIDLHEFAHRDGQLIGYADATILTGRRLIAIANTPTDS